MHRASDVFVIGRTRSFCRRRNHVHGIIWKNLNGWLIFRQTWFTKQRRDRFYKKDYTLEKREYGGHVSHQLWKEARERVLIYKYNCKNRMTPTNHKAWLRQQLSGQVGKRFGSCSWLWTDVQSIHRSCDRVTPQYQRNTNNKITNGFENGRWARVDASQIEFDLLPRLRALVLYLLDETPPRRTTTTKQTSC
jgi:hypothetical protein